MHLFIMWTTRSDVLRLPHSEKDDCPASSAIAVARTAKMAFNMAEMTPTMLCRQGERFDCKKAGRPAQQLKNSSPRTGVEKMQKRTATSLHWLNRRTSTCHGWFRLQFWQELRHQGPVPKAAQTSFCQLTVWVWDGCLNNRFQEWNLGQFLMLGDQHIPDFTGHNRHIPTTGNQNRKFHPGIWFRETLSCCSQQVLLRVRQIIISSWGHPDTSIQQAKETW